MAICLSRHGFQPAVCIGVCLITTLALCALLLNGSSGPTSHGISLWRHSRTLSNSQAHANLDIVQTRAVHLFVGVLSRSSNLDVRQAIRQTWGRDKRLARVVFFVLRPRSNEMFRALREECVKHKDMVIVSSHLEHYRNITYSTLAIFKSAALFSSEVTHVLKTDDDCFMRVDRMLDALAKAPMHWMYGGGRFHTGAILTNDPQSKVGTYVPSSNWVPGPPLPTYAYGLGAVLSMDLVQHIAAGAAHMTMPANNLLRIEDVATGIWVDQVAKDQNGTITYVHLPFEIKWCRPTDAITHMYKSVWPSTAYAHKCLFDGSCAYMCNLLYGQNITQVPA